MERVVDLVRSRRNDVVKKLLERDAFEKYFEEQFKKSLSRVKSEFVRRELKELLIMPVDLVHYARLITQIHESGVEQINPDQEALFYKEVDQILGKYTF